MKKIVLMCAAGMSTSLLVSRMKQVAMEQGKEYDIAAYTVSDAEKYVPDADVVLIGPQVRFSLPGLKQRFPDKKIDTIDMRMYGMMDGKGVLAVAEKAMAEE